MLAEVESQASREKKRLVIGMYSQLIELKDHYANQSNERMRELEQLIALREKQLRKAIFGTRPKTGWDGEAASPLAKLSRLPKSPSPLH